MLIGLVRPHLVTPQSSLSMDVEVEGTFVIIREPGASLPALTYFNSLLVLTLSVDPSIQIADG
jgi:hypothetical protein